MTDVPRVTVLVPAKNEARDIERCLRAVLAQDHPHDRMEVVVVDGGSEDGTPAVATRVLDGADIAWNIVHNPTGTTPSNLNAGLSAASGQIICRVDARSVVPPEYVRICAELLLSRRDVAVVGGAQIAVASEESCRSAGIARALNNSLTMGGARYRSGGSSGPTDTVYLGAFRAEDLRAAGGWNELFLTNQDYELNRRLGRTGMVWFEDRLRVGYRPRQTLVALWQQYYRFGRWKVIYWRITGDRPQARQMVPLVVVPGTLAVAIAGLLLTGRPLATLKSELALLVGGAMIIDHLGAEESADLPVRLLGSLSVLLVVGGWSAGVLRQTVEPPRGAPSR